MDKKLFEISTTQANLDKLKEVKGGMMNFFTANKRSINTICNYKNNLFLGTDDSYVIIYDYYYERVKTELNDLVLMNLNLIELSVLYQQTNFKYNDLLLCLCDYKLLILDANSYSKVYNLDFKYNTLKLDINYQQDYIQIQIIGRSNFTIYELNKSQSDPNDRSSQFLNLMIDIPNVEILNKSSLFNKNFSIIDTKNKLLIYKFKFFKQKINKINDLKEIKSEPSFRSKLISKDNDDQSTSKLISINKKDSMLFKIDSKLTDVKYNIINTIFDFSEITNIIYFVILNKLILVKNTFTEYIGEDFEVVEKYTKISQIQDLKICDFYLFILLEKKLFIYFITELERSVEIIDFDNMTITNTISYIPFISLNRFDCVNSIKLYNDDLLMFKLIDNPESKENITCSLRSILYNFDSFNLKIRWIYSKSMNEEIALLKNISTNYYSEILKYYLRKLNLSYYSFFDYDSYNKSEVLRQSFNFNYNSSLLSISKEEYSNIFLYDSEVIEDNINIKLKSNRNIVLSKSLYFIFDLIKNEQLSEAQSFIQESTLDVMLLLTIIKPYIYSVSIISMLNYYYNKINFDFNSFKHYEILNDKLFSLFIKAFLNRIIVTRNNLKKVLLKEDRKELTFIKNNYENMKLLNLKYIILENIVFLLNVYCVKLIKSHKYKDNLNLIIKQSNPLIDDEYINVLYNNSLKEEAIMFLFYKNNFSQCLLKLIEFYNEDQENQSHYRITLKNKKLTSSSKNSITFIDEVEELNKANIRINNQANLLDYENSMNETANFIGENQPESISQTSIDKLNSWYYIYINLICHIRDSITKFEFLEYLKWPLELNGFITLNLIYRKGKINISIIDTELLGLLKSLGIDCVIHYFELFLNFNSKNDNNKNNIEEILKLYLSKISIILIEIEENTDKQERKNSEDYNSYFKKSLQSTRSDLINFLLKYHDINSNLFLNEIEKIQKIDLKTEKGLILINKYIHEQGVKLIFEDNLVNLYDILVSLVKNQPSIELIKVILLNTQIYNNMFIIRFLSDILSIIKDQRRYDILEELLITDIFNSICPDNLLDYFLTVFSQIQNDINSYKIKNSLSENKILNEYHDLYISQSKMIRMSCLDYCKLCQKGLFELNFVYLNNNAYHISCFDNISNN